MNGQETGSNDILPFFTADRFAAGLGIVIEEIGAGRARASFTVRPDMLNGAGIGNGGAAFTLADYTLAIAVNTVSGTAAVTAGMNIHYLRPAKAGDVLRAEAECRMDGQKPGRLLSGDVAVVNQDGETVASGTGLFYRSNKPIGAGANGGPA